MTIELTVTVKDEERTFRKKHLIYEDIHLSDRDPIVQQCIKDTVEEFKGEPDDVVVRAVMVIK